MLYVPNLAAVLHLSSQAHSNIPFPGKWWATAPAACQKALILATKLPRGLYGTKSTMMYTEVSS